MGYARELVGVIDGTQVPAKKADGGRVNAKRRTFLATLDLSLAEIDKTATGNNIVFRKPRGHTVLGFKISSSVSLTTSQFSFGITGTVTKYANAKAYGTIVDEAISYQKATAMALDALDSEEVIIMTTSVAVLPGAGIVVVQMDTLAR